MYVSDRECVDQAADYSNVNAVAANVQSAAWVAIYVCEHVASGAELRKGVSSLYERVAMQRSAHTIAVAWRVEQTTVGRPEGGFEDRPVVYKRTRILRWR